MRAMPLRNATTAAFATLGLVVGFSLRLAENPESQENDGVFKDRDGNLYASRIMADGKR